MKINKKKGFTLVELLAVIVILAIILVIAVPQIMDTIKDTTKASFESSAKMVAAQVENQYTVAQTLNKPFSSTGSCMQEWAGLNSADYDSCTYEITSDGTAKVTLVGKGKFKDLSVCEGTRSGATAIEDGCLVETAAECFAFDSSTGSITGYDIDCGTDVVIPSKINNVTVTAIGIEAFTNFGEDVAMLSSNNEYEISNLQNGNENIGLTPMFVALEGIGITSVVLPNTVETIGDAAFFGNLISRVNIPNGVVTIGEDAFSYNDISEIKIPSSVTSIGAYAFYDNPLTNVYLGNQNATIGNDAFGCQDNIETHNLPSSYAGTCE